ncbi:MAG: PorV/PorQ family protein [Candidatus Margulisiibacteriota bacterium]
MRKYLVLLFVVFLAMPVFAISADISEVGIGARPLSLGSAYTALSDDGSALFTNPAGISNKAGMQLISMAGQLLEDVNYVMFGISNPSPIGDLGICYINASTGSIPLTTLTRTVTQDVVTQTGSTDYYSNIIGLVYARQLYSNVSIGGNLKFFSQGFSNTSGDMSGAVGTGMDLDLGLKWNPAKGIKLGLMAQNILPATMGGKFIWVKNNIEEGIPSVLMLGSSLKLWGREEAFMERDQELNLTIDSEMRPVQLRPGLWHIGVEWWPVSSFALRLGLDQAARATETGVGVDSNLTGGIGLRFNSFTFDYAYHQYGDLMENNTHFFSFGYVGSEKLKVDVPFMSKGEKSPAAPALIKPRPVLMTFDDVPEGFWAKEPIEYLATLGTMTGYPDGTFHPENALTRAEMAALLVKAKGFEVVPVDSALFTDLPVSHWAASYVNIAVQRGYVKGYPDNTFKPAKEMTRAEAVAVISRFAGLSEYSTISSKPFPDVSTDFWAAKIITSAKIAGLLEYLSGKEFEQDAPLTRAEAAEILSKTKFAKEKIKGLIEAE